LHLASLLSGDFRSLLAFSSQLLRHPFNFLSRTPHVIFEPPIMDSLTTHPSNAQQARAFTSTASLSFPGGAGDLTPPGSDKEAMAQMNGQVGGNAGNAVAGTGVTPASPATPAATPGATTGSSGIVPTLQ
jgi:hypothetical protein